MNYSISAEKLQSQFNQSKPAGLILATYLSLQRLNRSKYQLEQIAKDHPDAKIRKSAKKFLQKNVKLGSIAIDLIERLKSFTSPVILEVVNSKMNQSLIQLKMEVDMLDDMHFEVAKSYAAFIYENYEATVIYMEITE